LKLLPKLQKLFACDCQITDAGVRELTDALPDLTVYREIHAGEMNGIKGDRDH
jgi:hypothetical protein